MATRASWAAGLLVSAVTAFQMSSACGGGDDYPPLQRDTTNTIPTSVSAVSSSTGGDVDLCQCLTAIFGNPSGKCYTCGADQGSDKCAVETNNCAVDPFCTDNRGGSDVAYPCVTGCSTPACRLDCVVENDTDQDNIARGKRHFRELATCICAHCAAKCALPEPVVCDGQGGAGGMGDAGDAGDEDAGDASD